MHRASLPVERDGITRQDQRVPGPHRFGPPDTRSRGEMQLNENADLDTSQVEVLRGSGGGGGLGGGGLGGGGITIPIGGDKIGLIITIIVLVATLCTGGAFGTGMLGGDSGGQQADNSSLEQKCGRDNPNRFQDTDCR